MGLKWSWSDRDLIQTPIWDKGTMRRFEGTSYFPSLTEIFREFINDGKKGMPLEECSRQIADIVEKEKSKNALAIVEGKFFNWFLPIHLPERMIDSYFEKLM